MTLLTSNGGETLTIGEEYNITWETNMPGFDARIWLSIDNGASWEEIQPAWAPNSSPYPWKVGYKNATTDPLAPPNWVEVASSSTSECLVRIEQYDNSSLSDTSDAAFTIEP